ncbi:MAG TPA: hypothetical protein VN719_09610 [Gemmatimonadales bacterium]|nr:hypothetical protein [Gemmatimonadales bacterium]
MPAPTVKFKVLAHGYEVHGGQDGLEATVPFLVAWSDAFVFHDQVLGFPYAPSPGKIVYTLPWAFPGAPNAKMYAYDCLIQPIGQNGLPLAPNYGLAPGEFFTHSICTVKFKNRTWAQQPSDDPNNMQQFDPSEPIFWCEQRTKGSGKTISQPGKNYLYDDGSNKPLQGEVAAVFAEVKLVLTFPWVPFLPWQQTQTYLGGVNLNPILGCPKGTLLFEEFSSDPKGTTQGLMGQQVSYSFAFQTYDWNKQPKDGDGTPTLVKQNNGSGNRIYAYKDFLGLFFY